MKRLYRTFAGLARRPRVAGNLVRGQGLRAHNSPQMFLAEEVQILGAIHLRDGLLRADRVRIERNQNIFLVDAGQRHHGIHVRNALLRKQVLQGTVSVDDACLRQEILERLALLAVRLHDGNREPRID